MIVASQFISNKSAAKAAHCGNNKLFTISINTLTISLRQHNKDEWNNPLQQVDSTENKKQYHEHDTRVDYSPVCLW